MRPSGAFGILALAAGAFLIAAAIFLTPLGAGITIMLMISIIGIPIALVLSLIPPLALLLVLATAFAFPVRRFGWPAVALAFLPAAAIMYYAPALLNRGADAKAFGLVAGDVEGKPAAFDGRSLAIFVKPEHDNDCLDFCQRALVSGAVDTFIVARPKTWPEPDFSEEGVGYWLEQRESCEPRKLRDNTRGYPVALQEPSAAPAMRLLAASGKCLVAGPRKVADADAALFHRGMTDAVFHRDSLDPFHVPIRATRLSWYARENGVLTEKLRRTAVEYMTLQAPLFPGFSGGAELRLHAGLMRQTKHFGAPEESLKLDPLLAQLGFDLRIDAGEIEELRLAALQSALSSPGVPGDGVQAMAADVIGALEAGRGDMELAIRLVADPRFDTPENLSRYVHAAYKQDSAVRDRAMTALFDRLDFTIFAGNGEAPADNAGKREAARARIQTLRQIAWGVGSIPNEDFARHWPRLRKALSDPKALEPFDDQIRRAHLAGEAAFGDMLKLIDEAAVSEDMTAPASEWRSGRYYALTAICRMGPAGRPLLPELERRMADGTIPLGQSSDWDFAARTLRALGGEPAFIRAHAKLRTDDPKAGERLERTIRSARDGRRC